MTKDRKETKATAPSIESHVAALDAQFADLRDRLPAIQSASQDAEATADRLRRKYEQIAYQKHLGQDAIDEGTLAHAFAEYEAARRRQNDADVALAAVAEQLSTLNDQQEAAKRADAAAELTATRHAFEAMSAELDRLGDQFAATLREWLDVALQRHGLTRRTGRSVHLTPSALATAIMLSKLAFLRDLPRPISDAPEFGSFEAMARRFYVPASSKRQEKAEDAA